MPRHSPSNRPSVGVFFAALAIALTATVAYQILFAPLLEKRSPELVRDEADLLSPAERDRLSEFHRYLLFDHDVDYRVATVNGAGDLSRHAVELFERLHIGEASTRTRGLLLVIDPAANRVRLEVGRSLEGSIPDAFIAYIEERQMVPFFRRNRVADGILATTELIVQRIQDEKKSGGFEDQLAVAGSAGGGAAVAARIGAGAENRAAGGRPSATAIAADRDSPSATVKAYLEAMSDRNADPDLEIYTRNTRRMLADWTMTAGQMDNLARIYRRCRVDAVRTSGRYAVVRYGIEDRACAPFFLQHESSAWRLDLTMMQGSIRFGRNNAWRLVPGADHPYAFAFDDWRFDGHGFPVGHR